AVIEIATAAGLALLGPEERDPLRATSYGAGQLIRGALDRGCRRVFIGLGGSATVDGAAGLVEALGVRLLDSRGQPIGRGGGGLAALAHIDASGIDPRISATKLIALCDVDNVLLGEEGAARVFGPQKGATPPVVEQLEKNLAHLADVIRVDLGLDVRTLRHSGAAGGMAAGLVGMLGATLTAGADRVLDLLRFDEHLHRCDLVVTAEGLLDRQTSGRKAPWAVAARARSRGIPVIALAGGIADGVTAQDLQVFDATLALPRRPMTLDDAMANARPLLVAAAEQLGRLLGVGSALARPR
ncbi:MAG TPA: glycerate kinase, partial [Polyangiaceae bacterium]